MIDNLIQVVENWLENQGYELQIDENSEYLYYYNDNLHRVNLSKNDKFSLTKLIDKYNMYDVKIINDEF